MLNNWRSSQKNANIEVFHDLWPLMLRGHSVIEEVIYFHLKLISTASIMLRRVFNAFDCSHKKWTAK